MLHIISLILFFNTQSQAQDKSCIKTSTEIPLSDDLSISYLRVHPSGNYLLYTDNMHSDEYESKSSIIEIKKSGRNYSLRRILTPLMEEAYPVEPNWDLISSPYHDDGTMKYYSFNDLITKDKKEIKEVHSSTFNEFYHSIGGSNDSFTMVRWNFLGSKDFQVSKKNNKFKLTEGATFITCHNLFEVPESLKDFKDFLNNGMFKVYNLFRGPEFSYSYYNSENKVRALYKKRGKETGTENFYEEVERANTEAQNEILRQKVKEGVLSQSDLENWLKLSSIFETFELKAKKEKREGGFFDNLIDYMLIKPIQSKDGKYISGAYKGETRVYKIEEDKTCTEIASLGAEVSKSSFAYPDTFKNPVITFYAENIEADDSMEVFVFDPVTKTTHKIAKTVVNSDVGFPGFTRDGRLIYINDNDIKIVTLKINADKTLDNKCTGNVNN